MSNSSAESPIDSISSKIKTQIESDSLDEKDVESLLHEIELLKVNNENMRAKLLESSMLANNYLEETNKLKRQIEQLTTPPLFIATVMEVDNGQALIRQHGNNQEVVTKIPANLNVEAGMRVCVNAAFSIISIITRAADVRAQVMELINSPGIDYDMIGGLDDVLKEVIESVELPLLEPELFEKIGIEPPTGVLMYGAPGTGKTLIAKAVASRANATFIRMSGSDLVQKFVGEGARLVKDVFQMARDKSPSILFIDEIDAVGGMRTHDGTTGSAEVNRTMLQLLAEMDGFDATQNVKVIAATNRIDLLDPALLRPGRFDRVIEVPLPDEKGRNEIFKIHTRKMNLADDVDFDKLARMTNALSGADIKVITKEAGMFVLRRRGESITMQDLLEAYEKVVSEEEEQGTPHSMFV
ncbi:proteasome-activating nucleotidase [Methanolobus bombayensis]|uniref:proteasome-activating nucleotidase n=1 Tax=Methanolobus bombayensis TaxID=38023 RepID=UPI001AE79398|nr:proteasome-activating nucleotidase [Methanolobus bombayensis]MBP1908230.1 proteasome regulatory subunit [Methanolobus bombayensis]